MGKRRQPRTCRNPDCRQVIKLARVQGKTRMLTIAVDPEPTADGTGSVAAYISSSGGLLGRFLAKTEQPYGYERRYAQHTCPKNTCEQNLTPAPAQPAPQPATLFD